MKTKTKQPKNVRPIDPNREGMHAMSKAKAGRELHGRTFDEFPPGTGYGHPDLTTGEQKFLAEREKIVGEGLKHSLAAARALYEIRTFEKGKLWKATHRTFIEYCEAKWGYRKSYAYELAEGGEIMLDIEAQVDEKVSGIPEWRPTKLSHLRPLRNIKRENRGDCWISLLPEKGVSELTSDLAKEGKSKFVKAHENVVIRKKEEGKTKKKKTPKDKAAAALRILRDATLNMPKAAMIEKLLDQVEALFE